MRVLLVTTARRSPTSWSCAGTSRAAGNGRSSAWSAREYASAGSAPPDLTGIQGDRYHVPDHHLHRERGEQEVERGPAAQQPVGGEQDFHAVQLAELAQDRTGQAAARLSRPAGPEELARHPP